MIYILLLLEEYPPYDLLAWNIAVLAGMQNNKLLVWYHPAVVFTDRDLLPLTVVDVNKRSIASAR